MSTWRELTFPATALKNTVLVIEDDRANILADPLRWRILEILGAGKSVAEISQALEVTDARVLYHLKRLAKTGVVHLVEDEAGPQEWCCLPSAGKIRVREIRPANGPNSEAMPTWCCQSVQSGISRSCRGFIWLDISDVRQSQSRTTF